MASLGGKIAIVTGASRGIGRAIALRLAREGACVVLCARDAGALAEVAREIATAGGVPLEVPGDLRDPAAPAALVDAALARFNEIDIVVNNAGATRRGAFEQLSDEDWADGFALKFFGAVRLIRAAWPHLVRSRGSVVNIAGVGGRTPGPEFALGGSVNAAMLSLTKSLAAAGIEDGVQVNAVNPGAVRTDRLRKRLEAYADEAEFARASGIARVGEPEEIAALVAHLVGPEGRFLQGALIDIDGGQTTTI